MRGDSPWVQRHSWMCIIQNIHTSTKDSIQCRLNHRRNFTPTAFQWIPFAKADAALNPVDTMHLRYRPSTGRLVVNRCSYGEHHPYKSHAFDTCPLWVCFSVLWTHLRKSPAVKKHTQRFIHHKWELFLELIGAILAPNDSLICKKS